MSPEEKIEAAQKLIDEARAEIAAKKRNWPEKIEPGMLFRSYGKVVVIPPRHPVDHAISLDPDHIGTPCYGWEDAKDLEYLGHARDILTIRTDAHEPTWAELVGKVCEYSDSGFTACMTAKSECRGIGPHGYMDSRGTWYRFARLAR